MATVKRPLYIAGAGAVTPAGLDMRQTAAAIRAGLSAFEEILLSEPFGVVQTVARIPGHWRLRPNPGTWLVNMAARAALEAVRGAELQTEATVLLLTPPETFRNHPAYVDIAPRAFLPAVIAATGQRFHPSSRAIDGGAAATALLLRQAASLMDDASVGQILIGGVDSLVNDADIKRLTAANRLKGQENAQGLVPGEASVFVHLTREPPRGSALPVAIKGVGAAQEADSVLSERYSQGAALLNALKEAASGPGAAEPTIEFVVSNGNGERYEGWEQMIARPRFYRTRREYLPTAYPAMTVGDVGAAGGALALMLAADSLSRGYAPGRVAMCEMTSEGGLRGAAVVTAQAGH